MILVCLLGVAFIVEHDVTDPGIVVYSCTFLCYSSQLVNRTKNIQQECHSSKTQNENGLGCLWFVESVGLVTTGSPRIL